MSPAAHAAARVWPSKYVWHQPELRELIKDTSVEVTTIATLVGALQDASREATIADLERGLDDFEDT